MPDVSHPSELEPSQWLDRIVPSFFDVPERRLLVAVLFDAVRLLRTGTPKQSAEVWSWVCADDGKARITFRALCDGLDADPDHVRRSMRVSVDAPGGRPHRRVSVQTHRLRPRFRPARRL